MKMQARTGNRVFDQHRLAIIRHAREVTGNVALTCRYYGISRQVFYVWYRRYEAEGPAGLRDRSTRPAHCPHETPAEVVEKIIYLRQNYHFGPAKISMYLKRYHDIEISNSGVWRILKRLDLNRHPASQRYKRMADRLIRISTALAVAAVAAVAAVISYRHAYELVTTHGETGLTARLLPFTVNGLILAASMLILDASRRHQPVPPLARWCLGAGIAATIGANLGP